jgi:hypothetical protein
MNERRSRVVGAFMASLMIATCAARAGEPRGVQLPSSARVGGQELVLNGTGLRVMTFFSVYAAALYLPRQVDSASEALSSAGPKRFTMVMLREVTARQLIDALDEGLRENHSSAELERLRPRQEALAAIVTSVGRARDGTAITLDYVPGEGTRVDVDGKAVGPPIAGADFFEALLRIWIGEAPVDAALKRALLGQAR